MPPLRFLENLCTPDVVPPDVITTFHVVHRMFYEGSAKIKSRYDHNCNWCGKNVKGTLSGKCRYVPENSIRTLSRRTTSREFKQLLSKSTDTFSRNIHRWTYVSPSNYAENFFSHYTHRNSGESNNVDNRSPPPPPRPVTTRLWGGEAYNY